MRRAQQIRRNHLLDEEPTESQGKTADTLISHQLSEGKNWDELDNLLEIAGAEGWNHFIDLGHDAGTTPENWDFFMAPDSPSDHS